MKIPLLCLLIILSIICVSHAETKENKEIQNTNNACVKSQTTALVLSVFVGYTGADRYYM
jgi:cell division protein FtsW (lipid II flippase)